jgi:hypothetical protein
VALMATILTIAIVVFILRAVLRDPQLVMTDEGFTLRSLLSKKKTYFWSDGYSFESREKRGKKVIAFRQHGSSREGTMDLTKYRESPEAILQALKTRSTPRSRGA